MQQKSVNPEESQKNRLAPSKIKKLESLQRLSVSFMIYMPPLPRQFAVADVASVSVIANPLTP